MSESLTFGVFFIVCVCVHMQVQMPTETRGIRSTGAKSHCEETDVGSGNWTWVLCKSNVVILNENPHRLIIGVALFEVWSYRVRCDLAG